MIIFAHIFDIMLNVSSIIEPNIQPEYLNAIGRERIDIPMIKLSMLKIVCGVELEDADEVDEVAMIA
jgi:hypothetical protein